MTSPVQNPLPFVAYGDGLTDAVYEDVLLALKDDPSYLDSIFTTLHPSDIADLLERLPLDKRLEAFTHILPDVQADVLVEVNEGVQESLLANLPDKALVDAFGQMESDDVVDIVQQIDDEDTVRRLRKAISQEERALLKWDEDSAGGIMQVEIVAMPAVWTVEKALHYLRNPDEDLPDTFHTVYVVNLETQELYGTVPLTCLVRADAKTSLEDMMIRSPMTVEPTTKQDEIVQLFEKYNLISCAVVDENQKLLGRITMDDVLDVILEKQEKTLMQSAGLEEGEDLFAPMIKTTRRRFPWLFVNLLTAIAASIVISLFQDDIDNLVALAVLMPIVASMGGNAGTQALTVTVRGLAMGQITFQNMFYLLRKELFVGSFNGVILALLVGLGTVVLYDNFLLGVVICIATIANHIFAALAGYLLPIAVQRCGGDPAISSGILLTTVTDVCGFFAFLGLAAVLLL